MHAHDDTPRMLSQAQTNAHQGHVTWAPLKSLWYLAHLAIALLGGFLYFSWSALTVFVLLTALTLCLGHSLGMHRKLIHNSYQCPAWIEYAFVYLGTLVGMAGPIGMIYQHDLRDWAQRQRLCHPYLRHGQSIWLDGWWQLNCDLKLKHPPLFQLERRLQHDKLFQFMEKTWMLQQLPLAALLFYFGGLSWVVWGMSARITVSVTGHWLVGYFAHNDGQRDWHVQGAAVQGHNIPVAAVLSMGESWHNNHHAFPGSAMLGIYPSQPDPGWWVLNALHNLGLVWNIVLPPDLPTRPELQAIPQQSSAKNRFKQPKPCRFLGLFGAGSL